MKVGDYVRTENGKILKITKFDGFNIGIDYDLYSYGYDDYEEQYYFLTDSFDYGEVDKHYIIKSSPNIIDLIEVGDYVNREKVLFITKNGNTRLEVVCSDGKNMLGWRSYKEKEFKSIVTKEQFKSMEYEVK